MGKDGRRETSKEKLGFGARDGCGEQHVFRAEAAVEAGEEHVGRLERYRPTLSPRAGRSRLHLARLMDFQFPARAVRPLCVRQQAGRPRDHGGFVPRHRSQELLVAFAVEGWIFYVDQLDQEGGWRFGMWLKSGDALDNAQGSELQALVAILAGGEFSLEECFGAYQGEQLVT